MTEAYDPVELAGDTHRVSFLPRLDSLNGAV